MAVIFKDSSGQVVETAGGLVFKPKQSRPEVPIGGVVSQKRGAKKTVYKYRRVAPSAKLAVRWALACKRAGVSVPLRVWESV